MVAETKHSVMGSEIVDFASAAEQTLRDLHHRVGLDAWWVSRRQGEDQVVLAAVDTVYGHPAGTVRSWENSFCRRVVEEGAPQVAPRVDDVPAFAQARAHNGLEAAAVLAVPITSPTGEVLGTVCALSRTEQPDLVSALSTVTIQASMLGVLLSHELRLAEQVRRAEHAERTAHTDVLTGLANRRGWDAAMAGEEARAARYASPAAVVVVDLDNLKAVNDTAGHEAGDQLLQRTAAALGERLRTTDVLARLGGDEFAVLLPETDVLAALGVCDQLRLALSEAGISASLGVGARRGHGGLHAAWRRADAAMYVDKASADHRARSTSRAVGAPHRARPAPGATGPSAAAGEGAAGVDALLGMVREQLGADVALVSAFDGEQRRVRNMVSGIDLPFGPGFAEPREDTYCQLLVDGRISPVVPDVSASAASDLPATRALGVGSYVGVPLRRSNGQLYGTLCTVSLHTDTGLRDRDAGVLTAVAGAVMRLVEDEDGREDQRHTVLARLDRLRAGGGLSMAYQPVMALDGLQQVGVEALCRFPAGTGGPAQWFAEATAAGVGAELELDAIATALAALPDVEGFLALNASAATLTSPACASLLAGAPLERLVVEVTEHEAVQDHRGLAGVLEPLRQRGLRVAVDDTGAGFASLSHVLALVPDLIKLDISLVRGIDTDLPRQAMSAALVAFAAATGAAVVAEGIETAQELACLRDLGVTYGQGYHLARPAPLRRRVVTSRS